MEYTIKQAAEKMNLTAYTLRYYDKEGLLPFVERDSAGNRLFTENDIEWLGLICCLKNTGMPIRKIKKFIQGALEGEHTLQSRVEMLLEHRNAVLKQMEELNKNLEKINHKINYYSGCLDTYKSSQHSQAH
ncbi:HTH-type transcriptional regulator AdhR [Ruminiclostridium hungatei]|uniref:HTH-type transcriptional regulator AdhR n=1 Tax=Ruminiclostridium hungatei TaxID=48256 RepID=A0A1V4SQD1_RUMHU|nr:MerR family transcriptional regulator [Ruminiclostridium hungatei]OPX46054.1 HTH-type transcriptional regulator AdhR [Ruminiclostridium hungatei]